MGRIFGTDGVRGVANGDLTIQLATDIGRAAGMVVEETAGRKPTFIVGKDTRVSSDMLEAALAAGLCSVGADVVLLGVVPVSYTHLDVYKRQLLYWPRGLIGARTGGATP